VSVTGGPGCHGRIDRADDPALPPAVLVVVHDDAPPGVLREVCAGAEEQGIPTAILAKGSADPGADAAGRHAAVESRLEVGVGIGADGAVVVRHALVPDAVVGLAGGAPAAEVRRAGADAARIVAGLPLG
jgi:hypothetical protein